MVDTLPVYVKTSVAKEITWVAEKKDELCVLDKGRIVTVVVVSGKAKEVSVPV